jgi:hypothetical protein
MLLLAFQSNAQLVTLTLDNIPEAVQCNEIWTEQNLSLSFASTTTDDCTPDLCFFGIGDVVGEDQSLWLYPSRLTVDLSSLQDIQMVEVDILDYCGFHCTQAFVLDNVGVLGVKGNIETGISETLVMENPTQAVFTELVISSCEGAVNEIRIYQNTSSIEDAASGVKNLLRTIDCFGREVNGATNQLLFHIYDDGSVEKKFIVE